MEAARSWMSTELENTDTEDYFTADVGEDRKAYIEAERYNQEIDNDSSFLWMEGSNFIEEETIETEEMQSEYYSSFGMDTNGYTEKFHELADAYRKCMDKITFTEEDGKEQAEQVLEDLGIDGMGLVDSDRTVWFPNGACSERNGLGLGSDALWQGDLDRGLPGYLYCFSKSVEGITSVPDGVVAEETVDSYVPPFQVETISILITEEGIKYFKWDGISEEVCTVTENTKLPSVRSLATELSINPNTIQRAYMELEQQGLICPVKGKGSFVTDSSRIRQIGMEETLSELKKITDKGMALGVGEEEMIGVIRLCYKEGNND